MKAYRINCIDALDHVVSSFEYHCVDDLDALDTASELCAAHGVEVWDGARLVIWMHKDGEARVMIAPRDASPNLSPFYAAIAAWSNGQRDIALVARSLTSHVEYHKKKRAQARSLRKSHQNVIHTPWR